MLAEEERPHPAVPGGCAAEPAPPDSNDNGVPYHQSPPDILIGHLARTALQSPAGGSISFPGEGSKSLPTWRGTGSSNPSPSSGESSANQINHRRPGAGLCQLLPPAWRLLRPVLRHRRSPLVMVLVTGRVCARAPIRSDGAYSRLPPKGRCNVQRFDEGSLGFSRYDRYYRGSDFRTVSVADYGRDCCRYCGRAVGCFVVVS
jgi:hypothetical protein